MESELATRVLEWVKLWRLDCKLTQKEFARKAGMNPGHYQHVEAKRRPDFWMSTLERLAQGCEMSPAELLHTVEMNFTLAEAQAKYGEKRGRGSRKK